MRRSVVCRRPPRPPSSSWADTRPCFGCTIIRRCVSDRLKEASCRHSLTPLRACPAPHEHEQAGSQSMASHLGLWVTCQAGSQVRAPTVSYGPWPTVWWPTHPTLRPHHHRHHHASVLASPNRLIERRLCRCLVSSRLHPVTLPQLVRPLLALLSLHCKSAVQPPCQLHIKPETRSRHCLGLGWTLVTYLGGTDLGGRQWKACTQAAMAAPGRNALAGVSVVWIVHGCGWMVRSRRCGVLRRRGYLDTWEGLWSERSSGSCFFCVPQPVLGSH